MSSLNAIYAPWDGNATAMATDIEEKETTVRQWRNRGNIPPRYWQKIIDAAAAKGHALSWQQFVPGDESPFPEKSKAAA